jgi:hypothetical protein
MALPTRYAARGTSVRVSDDIIDIRPDERDLARLAVAGEHGELTAIYDRQRGGIVGYVVNGDGERILRDAREMPDVRRKADRACEKIVAAEKRLAELGRELRDALKLSEPSDARELLEDIIYRIGEDLGAAHVYAEVADD